MTRPHPRPTGRRTVRRYARWFSVETERRDSYRLERATAGNGVKPLVGVGTRHHAKINGVWLLQNELPFGPAVEALLVAFDVKVPVGVEVA